MLIEGVAADLDAEAAHEDLVPTAGPELPTGPNRGRISVAPGRLTPVVASLAADRRLTWLAEWGVGTVHIATGDPGALADARDLAATHGGWLLRESGAPDLDPFGTEFPAAALQRRIRQAFDPEGKLGRGRVPETEPA